MNAVISCGKITGKITAPASKSYTHRALILAGLAKGKSLIKNFLVADDTLATLEALEKLGVKIRRRDKSLFVQGVNGCFPYTSGKIFLNLKNSGTSLRLLTSVAALKKGRVILDGEARLRERPIEDLTHALSLLGVKIKKLSENNNLPIEINGGEIRGGEISISGNISSQFTSSLLLIAPFAKKTMVIKINNELKSAPYVDLTIKMMKDFGVDVKNWGFKKLMVKNGQEYQGQIYEIEGDYSQASYFWAAAAILGTSVEVGSVYPNSLQGDRGILKILEKMGCLIKLKNRSVIVKGGRLKPVCLDMGNMPDLVPTVSIICACADGISKIGNISHLVYKESNRIQAVVNELNRMGIDARYENNWLIIKGGQPKPAVIETYNDHRIAMSFAVLALKAGGKTIIKDAGVVSKSYPQFFTDLQQLADKKIIEFIN